MANNRYTRDRDRFRSESPSRSRSRSRDRGTKRQRWHCHDDRTNANSNKRHKNSNNNKDELRWWHKIANEKSETHLSFDTITINNDKNEQSAKIQETKLSSTQIVNECIIDNAIYNQRMDALQRRKAEDNLIKMGINPFINNNNYSDNDNKSGVILMTEHLNQNNSKNMLQSIHRNDNYRQDHKYNKYHKHKLFKIKSDKYNDDIDKIDFSLHPEITSRRHQSEIKQKKSKENKDINKNKNGDYGKWLNDGDKDKNNCLFQSIFNDDSDSDENEVSE